MANKSSAIKAAQNEIKDLEKLKQMALGRKAKFGSMAPALGEEIVRIDQKIAQAKQELVEATSASDLVNTEVLTGKSKRKERRKERKAKRKARKEKKAPVRAERKKKRRGLLDKIKGFVVDKVVDKIEKKLDGVLGNAEEFLAEKIENLINNQVNDLIVAAIDKLPEIPGGDFVINATERLLKDSTTIVRDEIAGYLKSGALQKILDHVISSAREVLEDGAQGSDIPDLLVLAFEKVKDSGEFQQILTNIKDKIVERFFLILEAQLDEVIEKAEAFLVEKLHELLTNQAGTLVDLAIQQLDNIPGGDFVSKATERLLKDSSAIIEDELKKYIEGGGIRKIVIDTKDSVLSELGDGVQVQDIQRVLESVYEKIKASGDFQAIVDNVKTRVVARLGEFLNDLIDAAVEKVEAFLIEKLEVLLTEQAPKLIELGIGKLPTIPGGDFVVNATEKLLTDSTTIINEELAAYINGGGIKRIVDSTKDAVVAQLMDGAQLSDIQGALTTVFEDIKASGDFQQVMTTIKDRIIDRFFLMVDELINEAVSKVEDYIIEKLDDLLRETVPSLTGDAIDAARKKIGSFPGDDFVTNVTKRLIESSAGIIDDEIEKYIKEGAIREVVDTIKERVVAELGNGLQLSDIANVLDAVYQKVKDSGKFKAMLDVVKTRIIRQFVIIIEEEIETAIAPVIDDFLAKYGNYDAQLLDTGKQGVSIGPFWGFLNLELSIQADMSAKLEASRKGLGIKAKGALEAKAYAGVGISAGFELPVIGGVKVEGGIQGGPILKGEASISLELKNAILTGEMNPATLNVDMGARLYLETPVPDWALEHVPSYVPFTITVSGNTIYYDLGRINVLVVTTPTYSLNFDILKGKYNYLGAKGKYGIDLNPHIKTAIKDIKDSIYDAAEWAADNLSPGGIFSNIGSGIESAWDATADVAEDAWDATADFAEDAWDATGDALSDGWSTVKGWF